jgi:predicted RecA/RadA family phage recombinase
MAKNIIYDEGVQIPLAVTDPATPASGDPVLFGNLPGVALTDERADGITTVKTNGVAELTVHGHNGTANTAIAAGDIVYYNAAATPKLNVNTAGKRFGYALAAVASGAQTKIQVKIGY